MPADSSIDLRIMANDKQIKDLTLLPQSVPAQIEMMLDGQPLRQGQLRVIDMSNEALTLNIAAKTRNQAETRSGFGSRWIRRTRHALPRPSWWL